jgi:hypothetical protein
MLSQLSTAVMLRNIPNKAGRSASLLNYCLSDRQALSVWVAVCPSLVVGEVRFGKYDFMYFPDRLFKQLQVGSPIADLEYYY